MQFTPDESSRQNVLVVKGLTGKMFVEKMSADKMFAGKIFATKMFAGKMFAGKCYVEKCLLGEMFGDIFLFCSSFFPPQSFPMFLCICCDYMCAQSLYV